MRREWNHCVQWIKYKILSLGSSQKTFEDKFVFLTNVLGEITSQTKRKYDEFFFPTFAKILLSFFFIIVMKVFARTCRRQLSWHQAFLYKFLHLHYNVFVIYDELQAIPQNSSHDKVSQKHAENWQVNIFCRAVIPKKPLLCIFIEILLRHECTGPLYICPKTTQSSLAN